MRTIVVVPYDPNWPFEFEKIKVELMKVLKDSAVAVEHVGSTAVPGLSAKPIIDIDIAIDDGMFAEVRDRLGGIGYSHMGDLGIAGREAFAYQDKPHLMEHHLYVCHKDAEELRRHIALRDFLRTHEAEREEYGNIKLEMARLYPHDIDAYLGGKEPVIMDIYRKCGLDGDYKKK